MRDVILGLNDGLVSMFLLLLGVSGGGVKATEVTTLQRSQFHRRFGPSWPAALARPTRPCAGSPRGHHRRFGRCHQYGTFRIHRSV
jgi:hypothetical protein